MQPHWISLQSMLNPVQQEIEPVADQFIQYNNNGKLTLTPVSQSFVYSVTGSDQTIAKLNSQHNK